MSKWIPKWLPCRSKNPSIENPTASTTADIAAQGLGFTFGGPAWGIALATVICASDLLLPFWLRRIIFAWLDLRSGIAIVESRIPFQSNPRGHFFELFQWSMATSFLYSYMPATMGLAILMGSYLFLDLIPGSLLRYVKSDGPPSEDMIAYQSVKSTGLFYLGTSLILWNTSLWIPIFSQIIRITYMPITCLAVVLLPFITWDLNKNSGKASLAMVGLFLKIMWALHYLLDILDLLEASLKYHLPKSISNLCRWIDRNRIFLQRIPQHKYRPLESNQIRLLKLERRGIFSGVVRASLNIFDVEKLPSYEALSYHWQCGDPEIMLVNGERFAATASAHELLLACSSLWKPRLVWIDSVCINQADAAERASQVRLMRNIYADAERVIVWLGQGHDAHLAAAMLFDLFHRATRTEGSDVLDLQSQFLSKPTSPRLLALLKMLRKPYFSRVWVVQEVVVSTNVQVYHGGLFIPWQILTDVMIACWESNSRDLMSYTEEEGALASATFENVSVMSLLGQRSELDCPIDLCNMLSLCSKFESKEPQDKAFALLGLVSQQTRENALLHVDYLKAERSTFTDVAKYLLINCNEPLLILGHAGIGYFNKEFDVPSWVPRWAGKEFIGYPLTGSLGDNMKEINYHAATALEPIISLYSDQALTLGTIILDTISDETDPLIYPRGLTINTTTTHERTKANYDWHKAADILSKQTQDPYINGQSREEAFWRTLVGDRSPFQPAPALPSFEAYYKTWAQYNAHQATTTSSTAWENLCRDRLKHGDLNYAYLLDPDLKKALNDYHFSLLSASYGRRFGITKNGYMGLIPPLAEKGDLLCLILGAQTPVLLRGSGKSSGGAPTYYLVGECYIHGLMAGEILKWDKLEPKPIQLV